MKLKELINCNLDIEINEIKTNSRNIKKGDLFVCIKGANFDRHSFIEEAAANGAVCAIVSKDVEASIPLIKVQDPDLCLIELLKKYYHNPQDKLQIIGITGTDGKTTSAKIIQELIGEDSCGYIGTIGAQCRDFFIKTGNTTPAAEMMFKIFDEFVKRGIKYVALETSSEAFFYHRLDGIEFKMGCLTNITSDHMNTHKTLENYISCKKELFIKADKQILNSSDQHFPEVKEVSGNYKSYGYKQSDTLRIRDYLLYPDRTEINIVYQNEDYLIKSSLLGSFNVENLALALLACLDMGFEINELIRKCTELVIPGRMESINLGQNYHVVIDYAHTANAVKNVMDFSRKLDVNHIITVTGQAGGRDHSKRKIIGKEVLDNSDLVILTTDDPRYEDVNDIIADILEGNDNTNYKIIIDRPEAIQYACKIAKDNDLILLLGKGSDNYQAIEDRKEYYSEKEEAIKAIKLANNL